RVFGKSILKKDGKVNREKLGKIVFEGESSLLLKLNSITHPEIIRLIRKSIAKSAKKIVILDAPLLIEAGLKALVDKLIVVNIDPRIQVKRIQARTKLSRRQISDRIKRQIPLEKKLRLADFIIDNSKTFVKTKAQAAEIWKILSEEFIK
ncbi:MAG: dephospho-CoA kinase, partial [Candidatus Omnitrophica bacterium]|nr:dephospho-CoA kinase [Candidatus Omnitrophota bacterium]